ncbi:tRNA pseudouridine(38-40) synthase TruA [Candidatus Synechococcus calcipolaris G9]|uniref:tRNA pseudouridine synthase A n=1 Tax=Candidatus Synechococcus calcipolaris G9 TaxID=1497997 RepID=A0ABT6EUT4_9SYNE|nr:tRNA pseudouridine(38-40) synthase TruA [Candidatus Synechococcus calcipolaris]MDG2989609.1 tRNA pseudouridine(38-40) synthase TruA [Candidatus Synechococcus calcipolaris G9]
MNAVEVTGTDPTTVGQRVALLIQYQGTNFHGWQRQLKQRTVQGEIEAAIAQISGHPVSVLAAGRTDTGVHAAGQVAHFNICSPIPAQRWASVLNSYLPPDILIRASALVALSWHARFSASWRRYRYTLYNDSRPNLFLRHLTWHYYHHPLDSGLMKSVLAPLVGRHHLSAFHRSGSRRAHSWVDVQDVTCERQGSLIEVEVQASGFLYGMMRLLMGLLVQVGAGLRAPENFTQIWQQEQRQDVKYAAPAAGLSLVGVGYPDSPFAGPVSQDLFPHLRFSHALPQLSIA